MPAEESGLTWYFDGPPSFSSMVSQAFLAFGFTHAGEAVAAFHFCVTETKGGYAARLLLHGEEILWKEDLASRRETEHVLMDTLSRVTGRPLGKWGYLLGMRPVKALWPFLAEMGWREKAAAFLDEEKVSPRMKALLLATAECQHALLQREKKPSAALYVHIPFCPSHCVYCSFPSAIVLPGERLAPYTEALCRDIRAAGRLAAEKGFHIESVYLGGGTPTILTPEQMDRVLSEIEMSAALPPDVEWTVEAGRPDTMGEEMLGVLAAHGVSRISVNPQTMQERILSAISRAHTKNAVYDAFASARGKGFRTINMDFICGLPQQTAVDMEENLAVICQLRPENVTIHTLTVKRGSPFYRREKDFVLPEESEVDAMLARAHEALTEMGYHPYYLYRQKYMTDDFANVGYALAGHDSAYNIQMIGEHQHVIGAGAGAVSKAVLPGGFRLRKLYMPRADAVYRERLDALIGEREKIFEIL